MESEDILSENININIMNLNQENFKKYGVAIMKEGHNPPDSSGEGWECWYPIGEIMMADPTQVGIVTTKPRPIIVDSLEKHQTRKELIFAISDPIVQIVGLSSDKSSDHPDPGNTQAFLLNPGQGVLVNEGIWHSAAFPYSEKETQYIFFLAEDDKGEDVGFVPFSNGDSIVVKKL